MPEENPTKQAIWLDESILKNLMDSDSEVDLNDQESMVRLSPRGLGDSILAKSGKIINQQAGEQHDNIKRERCRLSRLSLVNLLGLINMAHIAV